MAQKMVNAYKQAPWRSHIQRLGIYLIILVGLGLVAGFYLYVTEKAAAAGVAIQDLEWEKGRIEREIATMNSNIGYLTSNKIMTRRADELGFRSSSPSVSLYIHVDGYQKRSINELPGSATAIGLPNSILQPMYTQSIWDMVTSNFSFSRFSWKELLK
ncbi:MAG: hypothetical protein JEZ00_06610 [Anaerolineaceae bacterium]|nr:hypothetical protein [Anaerolineaceae bacterium]